MYSLHGLKVSVRPKASIICLKIPQRGYNGEYSILPTLYYPIAPTVLTRFAFLSPTGSSLFLRFPITISVVLNLISIMGIEEPGGIARFMFISCFSWHSQLVTVSTMKTLLTFFLFSDDSFKSMFVAVSFFSSPSPGLTWIAQSR